MCEPLNSVLALNMSHLLPQFEFILWLRHCVFLIIWIAKCMWNKSDYWLNPLNSGYVDNWVHGWHSRLRSHSFLQSSCMNDVHAVFSHLYITLSALLYATHTHKHTLASNNAAEEFETSVQIDEYLFDASYFALVMIFLAHFYLKIKTCIIDF